MDGVSNDKELLMMMAGYFRFLAEKGGDLAATDKHGWSVFQYAIRYASMETVMDQFDAL